MGHIYKEYTVKANTTYLLLQESTLGPFFSSSTYWVVRLRVVIGYGNYGGVAYRVGLSGPFGRFACYIGRGMYYPTPQGLGIAALLCHARYPDTSRGLIGSVCA